MRMAGVVALVGLFLTSLSAQAAYPERTITFVVPYAAGGSTDIVARLVASALAKRLGQPVVVENRVGANGTIAERVVATAQPDGYTLLVDTSGIGMNPALFKALPFDAEKDFKAVSQLVSFPFLLVTNPKVQASTLQELVALAQKKPEGLAAGISGSSVELVSALFQLQANVKFLKVPYKGGAPAIVGLMANDIQAILLDLPNAASFVVTGQLRPLAVSGSERVDLLPDVPTARESGMSDFVVTSWFGMFAPGGTPDDIVQKLSLEVNRIMPEADIQDRLNLMGMKSVQSTPEEFDRFYRSELARWKDVVKRSGIPQM